MLRNALFAFESLEQRTLLTATLIGPAGTLSPDQQWLEYSQNGQAFLENLSTSQVTPIPSTGTFTGDSKAILYTSASTQSGVYTNISVYNIQSGAIKQIPFNYDYGTLTHPFSNLSDLISSPNGQYAAFQFAPGIAGDDDFNLIYLVDLNAGTIQNIGTADSLGPVFSPDSQKLAYATLTGVFEYNIPAQASTLVSIDTNGKALPTLMSTGEFGGNNPAAPISFSPDGRYIAFPLSNFIPFGGGATNTTLYIRDFATGVTRDVSASYFDGGTAPYYRSFQQSIPGQFSPNGQLFVQNTTIPFITNVSSGANTPISVQANSIFSLDNAHLIEAIPTSTTSGAPVEVYSYDIATQVAALLTTTVSGAPADGQSKVIGLAPDGQIIVQSTSTDLAANSPANGSGNLYLISATPPARAPTIPAPQAPAAPTSLIPSSGILSSDRRHVAYIDSGILHLVDTNSGSNIVVGGDGIAPQGQAFTAEFSPDGKTLYYATLATISFGDNVYRAFKYDLQTGQSTSVAIQPVQSSRPATAFFVSPDGRYAALQFGDNNANPTYTLFVIDSATGAIFSTTESSAYPAFSPDSKTIYISKGTGNPIGVFAVNLSTDTQTLISTDAEGNPLPTLSANPFVAAIGTEALVPSNDNHYLAFTLEPSLDNTLKVYTQNTYVRNMQTGVVTQFNFPSAGNPSSNIPPRTEPIAFSPGGQYLLEESNSISANFDRISLVNLSTGATTVITDVGNPQAIGFGPLGQSVIFDSSVSGSQQIYSYNISSGQTTLLSTTSDGHTAANGNSFAYAITPDGKAILLTSSATNLTGSATFVPGAGSYILSLNSAPQPAAIDVTLAAVYDSGVRYNSGGQVYLDLNQNGQLDPGEPAASLDSSHDFLFQNLAPGTYRVAFATTPDFVIKPGTPDHFDITLASGQTATANFQTVQTSSISGNDFIDTNANNYKDAGESTSVPGGTVYLDLNNNGQFDAGEPSSPSDNWTFNHLIPGTQYYIRMNPPANYTVDDPYAGYLLISTTPGQEVSGFSFGLVAHTIVSSAPASISGTVFNDRNGDGIRDGFEESVDSMVYIDLNNNGQLDAGEPALPGNGNYSFSNLVPGQYILRAGIYNGGQINLPGNALTVTLSSGQNLTSANLPVTGTTENNTLSGTVFNTTAPIAGATVYLDFNFNGQLDPGEISTTTNSAGAYTFSDFPTIAAMVTVVPPAGFTKGSTPLAQFAVAFADESRTVNFTLSGSATTAAPGSIRGGLLDPFGRADGSGVAYLDLNGNGKLDPGEPSAGPSFSFDNLAPGHYRLAYDNSSDTSFVIAPGTPSFFDIDVASGQVVQDNFNLVRSSGLSGQIFLDANGNHSMDASETNYVPDGTVYLDLNNNGLLDPGEPFSNTGFYDFRGLTPGLYFIRIIPVAGYKTDAPNAGYYEVNPLAGDQVSNLNFGVVPFGNSPDELLN